jgi:hypothetical protein
MDVPSIQVGGVPVINLNSPQPTYPAQTYTAHPVQQQQQPPSYHNQHQSSAVSPGAQGHAQPQAYIPQHVLPKPNDQRAMSVEMMDVGGLSLSSSSSNPASASTSASTQGYVGYKPESMQDGNGDGPGGVQSPVPQGQVRQPSAEEERLKDKVREAQEQVRTLPVSVGLNCRCSHAKRKLSPLYTAFLYRTGRSSTTSTPVRRTTGTCCHDQRRGHSSGFRAGCCGGRRDAGDDHAIGKRQGCGEKDGGEVCAGGFPDRTNVSVGLVSGYPCHLTGHTGGLVLTRNVLWR